MHKLLYDKNNFLSYILSFFLELGVPELIIMFHFKTDECYLMLCLFNILSYFILKKKIKHYNCLN